MKIKKIPITKKEKRLNDLNRKLVLYEGKLYRRMSFYEGDLSESISSNINHQEVIMLNVAIDDIRDEIEYLESRI